MRFASAFQEVVTCRTMRVGQKSWAYVLDAFMARASNVVNGVGEIVVIWREGKRTTELGMPSRRFSGITGMDPTPPEVEVELTKVPPCFAGLSAFALPRVLRFALRGGLGGRLVDLDQVNSHLTHALALAGRCGLDLPAVRLNVRARARSLELAGGSREEAKLLLLRAAYGGNVDGAPQHVRDVGAECRTLATTLARLMPEKLAVVATWGTRDPATTLLSYTLAHEERRVLDLMCAAAAPAVASLEHDGVVLDLRRVPEAEHLVRRACPVELAVKPYPQSLEHLQQAATERYPEQRWTRLSQQWPWRVIRRAREQAEAVLSPAEGEKPITTHLDFARVVAAELEGVVFLYDNTLTRFNGRHWTTETKCVDLAHNVCRDALLTSFGDVSVVYEHGKARFHVEFERPRLREHSFLANVRQEIIPSLAVKPPLLDTRRYLLAFNDGRCWNFKENKLVAAGPVHCASAYVPWTPDRIMTHAGAQSFVDDCMHVWSDDRFLDTDDRGEALKVRAQALAAELPFFRLILEIMDGCVDECLYMLLMMTRSASSHERFCEMLYVHGAAKTGKDTLVLAFTTFLGDRDEGGLSVPLPYTFFLEQRYADGRNNCTPFSHSVRGMRYVIVPEMKRGVIDKDLLKTMCEQQGSRIASRDCKGGARSMAPTYLIMATSNNPPTVGSETDTGLERRLVNLRLKRRFLRRPREGASEQRGEDAWKTRLNSGSLRPEQLMWFAALYPHMDSWDMTELPRPPRVEQESAEMYEDTLGAMLLSWLQDTLVACSTAEADTEATVKERAAMAVGKRPREMHTPLSEAGLVQSRVPAKRYYSFSFAGAMSPVRLRQAGEAR